MVCQKLDEIEGDIRSDKVIPCNPKGNPRLVIR